jgi:D-alanyl-lipoteichoic acid acyltransferase DltB (MBOAT superfamily)
MLFNSLEFIFGFLPATLLAYWIACRIARGTPIYVLGIASLVFYGSWIPHLLLVLLASATCNYLLALAIWHTHRRMFLIGGIVLDLVVLAYYKYLGFASVILEQLGLTHGFYAVILPLGLSFHTFQQIAYLVEVWRRESYEPSFERYLLFVMFFPQMVAGPIVRQWQITPQFRRLTRLRRTDVTIGVTIFVMGLFKKVVLADGIAVHSDIVFNAAYTGATVGFADAWFGAIAYALQIYFDFSGYSDMAIGLARMFSLRLPLNFNSPYKAHNAVEFWRRWHITLSLFLRDFLYIPLGGNRRGPMRRYANLLVVMLLGGLWHGANWTFIVWGGLHGVFLIVAHGWHGVKRHFGFGGFGPLGSAVAVLATFAAVTLAWVAFRAESLDITMQLWGSAFGVHGFAGPTLVPVSGILAIGALLAFVWVAPNTQEVMARYAPAFRYRSSASRLLLWQPRLGWAVVVAALFVWSLNALLVTSSRFVYFLF